MYANNFFFPFVDFNTGCLYCYIIPLFSGVLDSNKRSGTLMLCVINHCILFVCLVIGFFVRPCLGMEMHL